MKLETLIGQDRRLHEECADLKKMTSLKLAWLSNVQNMNLSEPLWIAGWGLCLIVTAMLARAISARSQDRGKTQSIPGLAQRFH